MSKEGSRIPVVLVFDENHARHAAVVLQSAMESLGEGYVLEAHLIVSGVSPSSLVRLHRLEESGSGLSITVHQGDVARFDGWKLEGHISGAAYLRLELAEHLGHDVGKVIYLDTDVLCLDSLHLLYQEDLGAMSLRAVRDTTTPTVSSPRGIVRHASLGIPADAPYFNSGVLLIDVARWRARDPLRFGADYVAANGDVQQALDQEVLNACFATSWSELPLRWNITPRLKNFDRWTDPVAREAFGELVTDAIEMPGIVHFVGPSKPWKFRSRKPWATQYMAVAKRTPFYANRLAYGRWRIEELLSWARGGEIAARRKLRRWLQSAD